MDILQIVRTIDGGIAVAVMLVIGWRLERTEDERWHDLMMLIDKLTNGSAGPQGDDDHRPD